MKKFISKNRSYRALLPIGIVLHETATLNATAENEFNYFNNNIVNASAHAFIDDTIIIETIPLNEGAWHAGRTANLSYIGVELCNFGDKKKFEEVWKRAVWYFSYLFINILKITTVTKDNLMSHYEVSNRWKETNHTDPVDYFYKFGKTVDDFRNDVQNQIDKNIPIVKENIFKVKNIIIYGNDVDRRAAEYMSDYLKCPIIHKDNSKDVENYSENIYVVGGNWKPTDKSILISGLDRYDTIKEVLKFIKKI